MYSFSGMHPHNATNLQSFDISRNANKIHVDLETHPFWSDTVTWLTAGLAAIGGAYFTYFFGDRGRKQQERNFNSNVRNMVHVELCEYKNLLSKIYDASQKSEAERNIRLVYDESYLERLRSIPIRYAELSMERKANVFKADTLSEVEIAFKKFDKFRNEEVQAESEQHRFSFREDYYKDLVTHISTALDKIK
jgi:hypothetical protein